MGLNCFTNKTEAPIPTQPVPASPIDKEELKQQIQNELESTFYDKMKDKIENGEINVKGKVDFDPEKFISKEVKFLFIFNSQYSS